VTLGKVSDGVLNEGFHLKMPFITKVVEIDNRVTKTEVKSIEKDISIVTIDESIVNEKCK